MTFTDYRTAARMRDVIAEVAGDVIDRKHLGYRYATVDSIDEVKNRANVLFGGEITPVPIRMGAIKPTADALVRVRGKHGDLHIEGIVDGKIGDFSAEHFTVDHITVEAGIAGGSRIDLEDTRGTIWFRGTGGPMGFKWRGDLTEDNHELQLVYRTNPNTLGVEDAASNPIMEWDTDIRHTHAFGSMSVSDILTIVHGNPQLRFEDTDANTNFWFHHQGNMFYLLPDRSGDGNWGTPYPFRIEATGGSEAIRFWHGAGGVTSIVQATGDVYVGRDLYINNMLFAWTAAGELVLDNVNEIRANDGGISDPSYAFTNSQDTGMYRHAGNPNFAINGVRVLHISNGLFTGIGDNTHWCGGSSHRWKGVYAVDGTINTSDSSEKSDVANSDLGLRFLKELRPRRWRWNWGNRPHYGLIAQEVKEAMDRVGIPDFAGYIDPAVDWVYDEDDPEISGEAPPSMGLRYNEFISPMIAAIQELADRVDALEGSPSGPPQ